MFEDQDGSGFHPRLRGPEEWFKQVLQSALLTTVLDVGADLATVAENCWPD
jgi:hypothetical protein